MFELLFERSADPIWLLDPESGVFVDCNQAAVELLRASSREALLQTRPEDLSPKRQPCGSLSSKKAAELTELSTRNGGHRFEWIARRFDGVEIPMEVVTTPIPVNGRSYHVVVARDITERKRAELALRESEQLLASTAENISEAIYRTGTDHRLIFVNQAYLKLFGYDSLTELQAMPRERLYACPETRSRLLDLLQREGAFSQQEVEYSRKDGSTFWGLTSGRIVHDPESGRVICHVGVITDITARRAAEEEIRQLNQSLERRIAARTTELAASEARFRALVEHSPEAIVVFDGVTGRFQFGNEHAERLYGVCAEALMRLTPMDVSPEFQPNGRRSGEYALEKMSEALAGGTPVFEWLHRHSSGRLIPTEVRLLRLPAEGQKLLRASIIDNSERRRRERVQSATYQISEAVHTAEDLDSLYRRIHEIVKSLMPAANFYIALRDPGGETFSFEYCVDERWERTGPIPVSKGLTGYVLTTGKPFLAGPHNAAVPGSVTEFVDEGNKTVTAIPCGEPNSVWLGAPLTIRGRTFGVIAVQHYSDPKAYSDEDKQILNFVALQIAQAIERKRAEAGLRASEARLRESEARFSAAFRASPVFITISRMEDGAYVLANEAFLKWTGYMQEEILGKSSAELGLWEDPQEREVFWEELRRTHSIRERECRVRSRDGRKMTMLLSVDAIEVNSAPHVLTVGMDITHRKRAEAELHRTLAKEKELGQLRNNFVSMVSHEFRTPLGIILSSAEILDSYIDRLDPEERREQLQSIQKNTRRMAGLMEEVLLLGMVEAGKLDFKPAPIEFRAFCSGLLEEMEAATDRKCPVQFKTEDVPIDAFADKRMLRHIFGNLIGNAIKYSPAGRPVEFSVQRQGRDALCVVRDRGVGIPAEDQACLFEAFHRGTNVKDVPGTGLGLTIVRRCVELHGGSIKIESAVGQGTTVRLTLPVFAEEGMQ